MPPPPDAGQAALPWYKRRLVLAWLAAGVTFVCVLGIWAQQRSRAAAQAEALAQPTSPAGLVLASQARGTSLTAVGRTDGLALPCTAWLLDTGAGADVDAVAMTAGRCIGLTDASTVLRNEDLEDAAIDFNAFAPVTSAAAPDLVRADVEEVLWASTRGTDLALLRLGSTYGELAAAGVAPITARQAPAAGTTVLWAGVPVTDVPPDQRFVRATRCTVGQRHDVVEGPLLLEGLHATDCTGILGGSAGSPVFDPAGAALGMLVSTTIGDDAGQCATGDPCEVGSGTATSVPDTSYVVDVGGLAGCWDAGELRLGAGCPLEDPEGVAAVTTSATSAAPGTVVRLRLDPQRPGPARVADRYGPLGTACSDPADWSGPVAADDWELDVTMPASGWVLACVGSPGQATPVVLRVEGGPSPS